MMLLKLFAGYPFSVNREFWHWNYCSHSDVRVNTYRSCLVRCLPTCNSWRTMAMKTKVTITVSHPGSFITEDMGELKLLHFLCGKPFLCLPWSKD